MFTLVNDYITHKSTIMLPQLVWTVLNVLFARKEVVLPTPEQAWMDQNSLIKRGIENAEYVQDFQRADNIEHLVALLDNLPLYAVTRSVEFQKAYGDPKTLFPAVNNVDFTGFTFVNLFEHPLFLEYYAAPITTPQTYFVQQFEEYMYSGKSLFTFFSKAPIMAMMECFTSGKVTMQQLGDACKDAKALGE